MFMKTECLQTKWMQHHLGWKRKKGNTNQKSLINARVWGSAWGRHFIKSWSEWARKCELILNTSVITSNRHTRRSIPKNESYWVCHRFGPKVGNYFWLAGHTKKQIWCMRARRGSKRTYLIDLCEKIEVQISIF